MRSGVIPKAFGHYQAQIETLKSGGSLHPEGEIAPAPFDPVEDLAVILLMARETKQTADYYDNQDWLMMETLVRPAFDRVMNWLNESLKSPPPPEARRPADAGNLTPERLVELARNAAEEGGNG